MSGIMTSRSTMSHSARSQIAKASAPLLEIFSREPRVEQLHIGRNVVDDENAGGHQQSPSGIA